MMVGLHDLSLSSSQGRECTKRGVSWAVILTPSLFLTGLTILPTPCRQFAERRICLLTENNIYRKIFLRKDALWKSTSSPCPYDLLLNVTTSWTIQCVETYTDTFFCSVRKAATFLLESEYNIIWEWHLSWSLGCCLVHILVLWQAQQSAFVGHHTMRYSWKEENLEIAWTFTSFFLFVFLSWKYISTETNVHIYNEYLYFWKHH